MTNTTTRSSKARAVKKKSDGAAIIVGKNKTIQAKKPKPNMPSSSSSSSSWNSMEHLKLKRFNDDDPTLTAGAKRDRMKHPHVAIAEIDPSGRSKCKLCGQLISKGSMRFGLWLECHKGYRNLCTLHSSSIISSSGSDEGGGKEEDGCFWKHPETKKLIKIEEIHIASNINQELRKKIMERFDEFVKENN